MSAGVAIKIFINPFLGNVSASGIKALISRLNIIQPRLKNDQHFPNVACGHWVDSLDKVMWQDDSNLQKKQQEFWEKHSDLLSTKSY